MNLKKTKTKGDSILAVFPTDPLHVYLKKGEVKSRYFNPNEFFEEIHVIDMSDKKLTKSDHEKVRKMAGTKKLVVHHFPAKTKTDILLQRKVVLKKILEIQPTCLRAYGVFHEGFLASYCSRKTGIPFVLSIHGNYTHHKYLLMFHEKFVQGFLQWLFQFLFLGYIVKQADEIIYVYKQALGTTQRFKIPEKNKHLIYNKVFYKKGSPEKKSKEFTLIYVGNFFKVKNQKFLLEVIVPLNVRLVLIGKGYNRENIIAYTKKLGVYEKIEFVEAVQNDELHKQYERAHAFISATKIQEISIPVIEAMASGLPIIHRKPYSDENVDEAFSAMYLVDYDVEKYRKAIQKFKESSVLRQKYSEKSLKTFSKMRGEVMEKEEEKVYEGLLWK